jgi:hypothetical protein
MVEFNEIELRDSFIKDIQEIYNQAYDMLGSEVYVDKRFSQEASFPACVVNILEPTSAERYADSNGTYQFINLSLNCNLYSNELENFSLDDSVIVLSQILIKGILTKYSNFVVTRNSDVPFRSDVFRRNVTFIFTYDHINKIIYSN